MCIEAEFLVGFIDLLGFAEAAKRVGSEAELDTLVNKIRFLHELFQKTGISQEELRDLNKEVLAFSDCLVFSLRPDPNISDVIGIFEQIMQELTSAAISQGECVANGVFIRGGIACGGWFHDGDILVSDALAKAYEIETRITIPVLSVSDELYQSLADAPDRRHWARDQDPIRKLFRRYYGHSTFYYLDYIRICVESVDFKIEDPSPHEDREIFYEQKQEMLNKAAFEAQKAWLCKHRDAIITGRSAIQTPKAKAKYEWLAAYHNSIVKERGRSFKECLVRLLD